jgi:3D (Asp-Asp-Asp) domain-containing protein
MSAVLGAALLLAASWCQEARVTGYVRSEYGPLTYDGTPIGTPEAIAAASWNIPIDSTVVVDGLGSYRVADRGMLGSSGWVDIAVWSRAEAYELTSVRAVCIYPPGER